MADEFMEMTSDDVSQLSPDEAKIKIGSVMREARSDPKHAYIDGSSPDHKRAVENMRLLHERANPQPEPQANADGETLVHQHSPEVVKAMAEGLEAQEQRQSDLYAEAVELQDELVEKYDFQPKDVPEDIEEYQVNAWRLQKYLAAGDYEQLGKSLEKSLSALERSGRMPAGKVGAIRELIRTEGLAPDLRDEVDVIAENIISMIFKVNKGSKPEK